jgi:divalent metal cation (Fe/Co/Zn/Cd) transporter
VAETISMRACLQEVNKVRGDRTIWRWFRESRQSELVVILGEDFAALLGLALALIAVLMTMLTGNPMWDGLGSMWIGVILIVVAAGISREIMALLIGQSADPETQQRMEEFLARQAGVEKVYGMITMQLGTTLMVAVKAKMRGASAGELVAAINHAEGALRAEFPEIQWLFFEPDVRD